MTNQEILEKAWQIATDRGWEFDNLDKWHLKAERKVTTVMNNWYQFVFTYENKAIVIDAERVIYDHDFAKALWGEREQQSVNQGFDRVTKKGWKDHLQAMVVADDPIKYLGEHI